MCNLATYSVSDVTISSKRPCMGGNFLVDPVCNVSKILSLLQLCVYIQPLDMRLPKLLGNSHKPKKIKQNKSPQICSIWTCFVCFV